MRQKHILSILMAGLFTLMTAISFGQEHASGAVNTKEGVDEMIDHHLDDSHYFDFLQMEKKENTTVLRSPLY